MIRDSARLLDLERLETEGNGYEDDVTFGRSTRRGVQ